MLTGYIYYVKKLFSDTIRMQGLCEDNQATDAAYYKALYRFNIQLALLTRFTFYGYLSSNLKAWL